MSHVRVDDPPPSIPVTRLLRAWNEGEHGADQALIATVYARLRAIARRQLRYERGDHTLQPTAVVHEAYTRLANGVVQWVDRAHFFAVASTTMRRILVDHARARLAAKRARPESAEVSGAWALDTEFGAVGPAQLLAIDLALTRLHSIDPSRAELVQLRFYGGLSLDELAKLRGCSRGTVVRQWRVARAWLFEELGGATPW